MFTLEHLHYDVVIKWVLRFIGIILSNFMIIEPIRTLFKLNGFYPCSTMIARSLDGSIAIWTPLMDATYFNYRRFAMKYSFIYISGWRIFKGAILVKVFKPPLVCDTSTSYLFQSRTVTTISILSPTLAVEHVSRRIQLMGILFEAFRCVNPMQIFIRPVVLLQFTVWKRSESGKLNEIFPDLLQFYQVHFMVLPYFPGITSALCWTCCVKLTLDMSLPPLPPRPTHPHTLFPLTTWI